MFIMMYTNRIMSWGPRRLLFYFVIYVRLYDVLNLTSPRQTYKKKPSGAKLCGDNIVELDVIILA